MISLNATIVVQVILFLILLVVLNRLMIRPLHQLVMEREAEVRRKKGELASAQEALRKVADEYQKRLKEAEIEARAVHVEIHREAVAEASEVLRDVQQRVTALRKKVQKEVAEELERARKEVIPQAEALSFEITQRVVGRRL